MAGETSNGAHQLELLSKLLQVNLFNPKPAPKMYLSVTGDANQYGRCPRLTSLTSSIGTYSVSAADNNITISPASPEHALTTAVLMMWTVAIADMGTSNATGQ